MNPDVKVLQLSDNTAIGSIIIDDISSARIATEKGDEVLAAIGDWLMNFQLYKIWVHGRFEFFIPLAFLW
jgi:hypothetical protein